MHDGGQPDQAATDDVGAGLENGTQLDIGAVAGQVGEEAEGMVADEADYCYDDAATDRGLFKYG